MDDEAGEGLLGELVLEALLRFADQALEAIDDFFVHEIEEVTRSAVRSFAAFLFCMRREAFVDELQELAFLDMVVNVLDDGLPDGLFPTFDVNAEAGLAHEREAVAPEPSLELVEVVADGAVRHMERLREREELHRFALWQEAAHDDRAPFLRRVIPLSLARECFAERFPLGGAPDEADALPFLLLQREPVRDEDGFDRRDFARDGLAADVQLLCQAGDRLELVACEQRRKDRCGSLVHVLQPPMITQKLAVFSNPFGIPFLSFRWFLL